jgi:hypothetical protein
MCWGTKVGNANSTVYDAACRPLYDTYTPGCGEAPGALAPGVVVNSVPPAAAPPTQPVGAAPPVGQPPARPADGPGGVLCAQVMLQCGPGQRVGTGPSGCPACLPAGGVPGLSVLTPVVAWAAAHPLLAGGIGLGGVLVLAGGLRPKRRR